MATYFLPDGSIKIDTESDLKTVIAYQRLKASEESHVQANPAPRPAKPLSQPTLDLGENQPLAADLGRLQDAQTFLGLIADGGQSGVQAETLQEALRVNAPRGMGAKVFAVKNVLKEAGITEADEVFRRERTPLGGVWQPGPRVQEAIQLVNGLLSRGQK